MEACGDLPLLPANLPTLKTEEALRVILRSKVKSDQEYRACLIKHRGLVEWIENGGNSSAQ
jgi:hypothetical protein